jgi:tetratricopeptide (TPR) repeat protein
MMVASRMGKSLATAPDISGVTSSRLLIALLALVLFAGTVAVYWPATDNEFVNYDDPEYVTSNPHVQEGLTWAGFKWAFRTEHASNWHPVTWLSHMLDWQRFGNNPIGHHLDSVIIHGANSALLFFVLLIMTRFPFRSAIVAALFAVHPMHVESVAWVSERKDVLSAFFFLLTLLAYTKYVRSRSEKASNFQTFVFYLLALALYALGLLSKPMLVTTPFVLLLLDWWPLGRCEIKRSTMIGWLPLVVEKLPFFLLSVGSSIKTFFAQRHGGAVSTVMPFSARILNAIVAFALYIRDLFWPAKLAVLYPHPIHWPILYILTSTVLLLGITAAAVIFGRFRKWLIVGWLWFLGTLVPAIGIVQVGIQCMADRYTYIPYIGLFVMIVWAFAELVERNILPQVVLPVATSLALIICGALTIHQIGYWSNSETLFEHTAHVTKNNYLAYNNLGFYLNARGKVEEAITNYRQALEINSQYVDGYNNMGYALASLKRYPEAIAHYRAALRFEPNHSEAHNNLGNALADTGQIDEAIKEYRTVLASKPEHADAHNNLGIALAMKGQLDEAIGHFVLAIQYKRNYASAHSNLGNALAVQHKIPEAIREYDICLKLNTNDAQAHNNIANALAEQGDLLDAVKHYQQALTLNTNNPEAHFNLGVAFKRLGQSDDATQHFQEALRLKPDYVEARKQLQPAP